MIEININSLQYIKRLSVFSLNLIGLQSLKQVELLLKLQ